MEGNFKLKGLNVVFSSLVVPLNQFKFLGGTPKNLCSIPGDTFSRNIPKRKEAFGLSGTHDFLVNTCNTQMPCLNVFMLHIFMYYTLLNFRLINLQDSFLFD